MRSKTLIKRSKMLKRKVKNGERSGTVNGQDRLTVLIVHEITITVRSRSLIKHERITVKKLHDQPKFNAINYFTNNSLTNRL
jgi:hypothetical protein